MCSKWPAVCRRAGGDGRNWMFDNEISAQVNSLLSVFPAFSIGSSVVRNERSDVLTLNTALYQICEHSADPPQLCTCLTAQSASLQACVRSMCNSGERLCDQDKICYADDADFPAKCSLCARNLKYCPSIRACVEPQRCPSCPEKAKPTFCVVSQKCVTRVSECALPSNSTDPSSVL